MSIFFQISSFITVLHCHKWHILFCKIYYFIFICKVYKKFHFGFYGSRSELIFTKGVRNIKNVGKHCCIHWLKKCKGCSICYKKENFIFIYELNIGLFQVYLQLLTPGNELQYLWYFVRECFTFQVL